MVHTQIKWSHCKVFINFYVKEADPYLSNLYVGPIILYFDFCSSATLQFINLHRFNAFLRTKSFQLFENNKKN